MRPFTTVAVFVFALVWVGCGSATSQIGPQQPVCGGDATRRHARMGLWSRRSGVRVPSLTLKKAPLMRVLVS